MKTQSIKTRICKKFGNVKNFSRLTGLHYMFIMNVIHGRNSEKSQKEKIELINYFIDNLTVPAFDVEINDHLRDKIRIEILTNFKTFRAFSDQHPEFGACYLSNIKTGKKTKLDHKAVNLLNILKIDF